MKYLPQSCFFGIALGASALMLSSHAIAVDLFTAQDVDTWNKSLPHANATPRSIGPATRGVEVDSSGSSCRSIPKSDAAAAPTIDIVAPTLDKPLVAPLDIDVKFVAAGADGIQPSTFKLCYVARFMTIDITDKIADKATVSSDGLRVAGAQLPSGHHHLVMLISDKAGHVGHREAIFDIK